MKSFIEKLFYNIWIRNSLFFLFLMLLVRLTNDKGDVHGFERFKIYLYYAVDFAWIFVHNKVLIERFLLQKKTGIYFLLLLVSYTAYFPFYYYMRDMPPVTPMFVFVAMTGLTANKLLGIGIYFVVRYIVDRDKFYKASITAKDLELELLKGQLNPHFLFNSLNNIYSHLLTDSKNGQELILKLSELMRYILDSSKKQQVSIQEEVTFIENYISFEKERLGDRCEILYQKKLQDEQMPIAPLILFTFVENAFKHGTHSISKSDIHINLHSENNKLRLEVKNPVTRQNSSSTQIGLKNTSRRLELIYPSAHKLSAKEHDNNYSVTLEITHA